jgi:membrane protein
MEQPNGKKPINIYNAGEEYESKYFELIAKVTDRLLHGFFHFKKRKGELLAGSATFFAVLSFCPVILLFISLTGLVIGDMNQSKEFVLDIVNSNFPHLAPWILESIEKIVSNQLKGSGGTNLFNSFLLLYSCLGVVTSMIFGLHYISKTEAKGGFVIEDFKSMGIGLVFTSFIFTLLVISNKSLFFSIIHLEKTSSMRGVMEFLFNGAVLPSAISLVFFTAFYKWSMQVPVRTKDAALGAASFVSCFMIGKSFHWVYMKVAKDALSQSYGNFETMIIAVLWVYFLMCAFFFGASVAHASYEEIYGANKKPKSDEGNVLKMPSPQQKAMPPRPQGMPQAPTGQSQKTKKAA